MAVPRRHLYLIRHGQYRSEGAPSTEVLTPLGRRQADRIGRRLRSVPLDAVHHSNMPRARETAERIAEQLSPLPRKSTRLLREGLPSVAAHFGPRFRRPRAELSETRQRMDRAFERYFKPSRRERHELLVAHGNVIRYLVRRALGDAAHRWWQMDVQHCGLTIVRVSPRGCALLSFNDVGHLPPGMQTFS